MSVSRETSHPDALLPQVKVLMAQGLGNRRIGTRLGIGKDAALRLVNKAKVENDLANARRTGINVPALFAPAAAIAEIEPATRAEFAARIAGCWRKSFEAVIEAGRWLARAKAALDHGEFGQMITSDLPFAERTAQRLMAIAADGRITNPTHVSHLPNAWGTLYELTKLPDDAFAARIADGTIRPDMERKEVEPLLRINGARALMATRHDRDDDALDFYPTPPWATRALFEHVMPQIKGWRFAANAHPAVRAWEPACGEGHIALVLEEYLNFVFGSDIHDYIDGGNIRDFLSVSATPGEFYWIITNPPFKDDMAERFTLRALELASHGVAMFVRVQFLETVGRYERLFLDHPPTLLAFFTERVNLRKGCWDPDGSTATAYCWLVWIKGRAPQAPFWIPPGCRERLTKPDDRARFAAWSLKDAAGPE